MRLDAIRHPPPLAVLQTRKNPVLRRVDPSSERDWGVEGGDCVASREFDEAQRRVLVTSSRPMRSVGPDERKCR